MEGGGEWQRGRDSTDRQGENPGLSAFKANKKARGSKKLAAHK
jgi:hypothetical protein